MQTIIKWFNHFNHAANAFRKRWAGDVRADYLPRSPRTLGDAARFVMERHAQIESKRSGCHAALIDVTKTPYKDLLELLGFTPDRTGLDLFFWMHQHEIAMLCHYFSLVHNCGEYCPTPREGDPQQVTFEADVPVFRKVFDRMRQEQKDIPGSVTEASRFEN